MASGTDAPAHLVAERPEDVRGVLEEHGVAVLPAWMDDAFCDRMEELAWKYLGEITAGWERPLRRDDPQSWRGIFRLGIKHGMLTQHFGVGQSELAWFVRQHPRVVDVFAKLWGVDPEDLLSSFDGASFHLPSETTSRGWFRQTWYHCDHNVERPDFESAQGWVTANGVRREDATLAVLRGSHRYHQAFRERFGVTSKGDWHKLTAEQVQWFKEECGCVEERISCPRGSMVLWDSRTMHCGVEPLRERPDPNTRFVVYTCYTPRVWATESMLRRRRQAAVCRRTSNHWPHRFKLFAPNPYPCPEPRIADTLLPPSPPVLTRLGKRLIGFAGDEEVNFCESVVRVAKGARKRERESPDKEDEALVRMFKKARREE